MKRAKNLWRISVTTSLEAEEAVAEMLGTIFSCSASSHFNVETGVSVVSVFYKSKPSGLLRKEVSIGLKRIKNCGLAIGSGKISIAKVRREDWAESWKRHFKPMEIGELLLVKPSWSKRRPRKNQAVVILDPGLSFGTGQHATTSFCLHQIVAAVGDRRNRRSQSAATTKSFLDIGTGSGILAIAASKLGLKRVCAFDFDPESVRVARTNARVNGVTSKIKITRNDVTKLPVRAPEKYDLVCANLISYLLIAERRRILNRLHKNGTLVLAGILAVEFLTVQRAFERLGLKLVASKVEKEWCSGSFCFA